ncbi:hypothetical protein IAQ61_009103 [Plenodomus lingam]|uniref:uncharacterized protein n=1 Tax=Leptosphaeria maculans TaxID=5022 RepID=UPI00332A7896|nr:hypothetical protein IAQ61_009103 [Plenodomus lingam]
MTRLSKAKDSGGKKTRCPVKRYDGERAQNNLWTRFCKRAKSLMSIHSDETEPKRIRIIRTLENLWQRSTTKKKSSLQDDAMEAASPHTPTLPLEEAVEKVIEQLNLLALEIQDIRQMQQADRALALERAIPENTGPGSAAQTCITPEIRTSDSASSSDPNTASSCEEHDEMAESASPAQSTQGPDADSPGSLTDASTPPNAESSSTSPPTSPDVSDETWLEPLFDDNHSQKLLHMIEQFRFTDLLDIHYIKNLPDLHMRVQMVCNNMLNIYGDLKRICSIWFEFTNEASSIAMIEILEPWKHIGTEATIKLCENLRQGNQLYQEWLDLVGHLRDGDEEYMGHDWWAEYDKRLAEIGDVRMEEFLTQSDAVQDRYSGREQDKVHDNEAPGKTGQTGREQSSSSGLVHQDASSVFPSSQDQSISLEIEPSSDLDSSALQDAVPRPSNEEQTRSTPAETISQPSSELRRERYPLKMHHHEGTSLQPPPRMRLAVANSRPRSHTATGLAPLPELQAVISFEPSQYADVSIADSPRSEYPGTDGVSSAMRVEKTSNPPPTAAKPSSTAATRLSDQENDESASSRMYGSASLSTRISDEEPGESPQAHPRAEL